MRITVEEGDQLLAGALMSEGEGDGVESLDGIEAEGDVVVSELIYEDSDRVKLFTLRVHYGQRGSVGFRGRGRGEGGRE